MDSGTRTRRGVLRATAGGAAGLALATAGGALAGCGPAGGLVGSSDRPLKLVMAHADDGQGPRSAHALDIVNAAGSVGDLVSRETGLQVHVDVVSAYAPMIAAMGAGDSDVQADIGFLTPFAYVLAHAKLGAEAILSTIRNGSQTYRSQIVVHADSGIKSLGELKGKRFTFVDSASTSGFLYPAAAIKERFKLGPERFFGQVFTTGSHDKVVLAVYNKQVDGGACRGNSGNGVENDARTDVRATVPDVLAKVVRVLEVADPIPNDVVAVRKGLPPEVTARVQAALIKIAGTEDGRRLLGMVYDFDIDGLRDASNADYEPVRQKASLLQLNLEQLISPTPTRRARP